MLAEISRKNCAYICKDFKIHEYLSRYCEIIRGSKAKAKSNASTSCKEMALSWHFAIIMLSIEDVNKIYASCNISLLQFYKQNVTARAPSADTAVRNIKRGTEELWKVSLQDNVIALSWLLLSVSEVIRKYRCQRFMLLLLTLYRSFPNNWWELGNCLEAGIFI